MTEPNDTPRRRPSFGTFDVRHAYRTQKGSGPVKAWARENATAIVKLHGLLPVTPLAKRMLRVVG